MNISYHTHLMQQDRDIKKLFNTCFITQREMYNIFYSRFMI